MKYLIDATVMIQVHDLQVWTDEPVGSSLEIADAVIAKLEKSLTIIDIYGRQSGYEGVVKHIQVEEIDNWNSIE